MTEQEPQCNYCGEKAVKTVDSDADKDLELATDHYYCEKHDKERRARYVTE